MNQDQQLLLNRMIKENDTQDNTCKIQSLKHSQKIRRDVSIIQNIKRKNHCNDFKTLDNEAQAKGCGFLFKHYPNIYNKLLKNQIQIKILYRFLDELEKIEKGQQNQHEASYKIGLLLKEMYIDKKIDVKKESSTNQSTTKRRVKKITYEEYKKQQEKNI